MADVGKILEPANIDTLFSDTVIGAHLSDQCAIITLGSNRIAADAVGEKIDKHRVVCGRLALTKSAIIELSSMLQKLSKNMKS